jgi:hypothetical protein
LLACWGTAFALLEAGMYVDKDIDTTSSLHFRSLISQNLGMFLDQERDRAQAQVLRPGKSSYSRTRGELIIQTFSKSEQGF